MLNVSLNIRVGEIFLQDGTPTHYSREELYNRINVLPHRCIGQGSKHSQSRFKPSGLLFVRLY